MKAPMHVRALKLDEQAGIEAGLCSSQCEVVRALLHQNPRTFGKTTSCWTLALAAEVCFERELTESQMSIETIRLALKRLGVGCNELNTGSRVPIRSMSGRKNDGTPR